MIFGFIGIKIGMTQIPSVFKNKTVPVTAVWVDENILLRKKNESKDGYNSCQLAFFDCSPKVINKAQRLPLEKKNIGFKKYVREIKDMDASALVEGEKIDLSSLVVGKRIKVSGTSKGKGFSGAISRHGFSRGRMSHGASGSHRGQGSICFGRGSGQKVIKGKKMAGHSGNKKTTKITLVEMVDIKKKIIFLRGSVPGPKKGLVVLRQLVV